MASRQDEESQDPLLQSSESNIYEERVLEKAVKQGARGAALLAKHLPTGSALVFEILAPITTARGRCKLTSRIETIALISLCAISSTVLTFTDSFKDSQNKIRYGIATCTGLLILDGTSPLSDQAKYKIKGLDFIHVITTFVIFSAVVLYNNDVVKCFWGKTSDDEY
ncbi:hypothetical protein LUZ60_012647 [Juncus effusus]|nr:hypothetical protein LUZ60_012647 [Juncus effusus]